MSNCCDSCQFSSLATYLDLKCARVEEVVTIFKDVEKEDRVGGSEKVRSVIKGKDASCVSLKRYRCSNLA